MKTKFVSLLLGLALVLSLMPSVDAQTTTTKTYLSSAITASDDKLIVASATGITASTASTARFVLINRELMRIREVSGTTLTVRRAEGGTVATKHPASALVVFGPNGSFDSVNGNTSGVFLKSTPVEGTPCTSTSNEYTSVFNSNGDEFTCLGSVWRNLTITPALAGINQIIVCGDLPNNTTTYLGAAAGFPGGLLYASGLTASDLGYTLAGTGCDALDNTTEGTADTVMFAGQAMRVLGMACTVGSAGNNGITLNMRASTANLTPDVSITIATGSTTGAVWMSNSPVIAANAPIAIRAISTEDLSASNGWCSVTVQVLP